MIYTFAKTSHREAPAIMAAVRDDAPDSALSDLDLFRKRTVDIIGSLLVKPPTFVGDKVIHVQVYDPSGKPLNSDCVSAHKPLLNLLRFLFLDLAGAYGTDGIWLFTRTWWYKDLPSDHQKWWRTIDCWKEKP